VIIVIIVLINACDKYSGLLFQMNMIIVAGRVCVCVQREFSQYTFRNTSNGEELPLNVCVCVGGGVLNIL